MTITTRIVQVDTMGTSLCSRTDSGSVDLAYTAYGHDSGALTDAPLMRFNGQLREAMCGHYLLGNGYRAYNSISMRFNSPDSLSPFGVGGVNAYAYCEGNPVCKSDSTGHVPVKLLSMYNQGTMPSAISGLSLVSRLKEPVVRRRNPVDINPRSSVPARYDMGDIGQNMPLPEGLVNLLSRVPSQTGIEAAKPPRREMEGSYKVLNEEELFETYVVEKRIEFYPASGLPEGKLPTGSYKRITPFVVGAVQRGAGSVRSDELMF
ncbi:RHS repeat-associated core domain-containing protein [Pseudomonas peradeniyensis]|uniref:RHS repeat-associated core domain-containing protein n=1 Tax=Pseudomonas peradeniyensis TaxID=2745488 RepID=UPI0021D4A769|nr:RHS repeat-associated core domain-containing protein [Pseudomonas peradeniyensis]MCU7282500.1 RHS repeat-associated core domain-containing protein [Pseudomonas peradeniyensis]